MDYSVINKNEFSTHSSIDESQEHYSEGKKQNTKIYIRYDSFLKLGMCFECLLIYRLLVLHPSLEETRPFELQFPAVDFADPTHGPVQHDPYISCILEARSRDLVRLRFDVFGIKRWHVFHQ